MSVSSKLLQKARNNPDGLSISDFRSIMHDSGWEMARQNGSHEIWKSPKNKLLPIQDNKGKAKGYQVKQFLKALGLE